VTGPENAQLARDVEAALAGLRGVDWAEVNAISGRVVVSFDSDQVQVGDLITVIGQAEDAHGLADESFPPDCPDYPSDAEPLQRQLYALGADACGLGLSLVGRLVRANPLLGEAASLISLIDATPALRRPLESAAGRAATDVGLAVGNAVAQGLAQGPLGLVVDIANRWLQVDQLRTLRELWDQREPVLAGKPAGDELQALRRQNRPRRLPSGPVESYCNNAAVGALGGAAVTAVAARDPQLIVAATATANPKPARLGREAFAARLGRDLARSGILTMDADALRRLDRVDTVLLDAQVLTTGESVVGSVWVPPQEAAEAARAMLAAHALLSPASSLSDQPSGRTAAAAGGQTATATGGEWAIGPLPRRLSGQMREAARGLRSPGTRLMALWRDGELFGLVVIEPQLDPLAGPLIAVARAVGAVVLAGRAGRASAALADRVVRGGPATARAVRALQARGAVVALVSAVQRDALCAADIGIGVPGGLVPPWGAHLITESGLSGAYRVLRAVPAARATSRRAASFAAYGSGAGAVLALSGPRAGAAPRSMIAVNSAALASVTGGVWSAVTLARQPPPVGADATPWHALDTAAVLQRLGSSSDGLPDDEARRRQAARPPGGQLQGEPGLLRASVEELANPLTPALASGAGLSAAVGAISDAALISSFMALNALLSGIQRVSVGRALHSLISESAVRVQVRRGGGEVRTTADQLVPGDVIVVQAGDAVPADCRILQASGLEVDESNLTGESQLVAKASCPTAATSIPERTSMLYAGTSIAAGTATAAVVGVGSATEAGRAEQAAEGQRRPSGVQVRLRQLTSQTVPLVFAAGAAVVGAGLLRGKPLRDTLGTAVSLAVAAVPEGLPIVATAAQYAAARRLAEHGALVRNPGTIEALGRVDVLCFDKTGTLTSGRIQLDRVWACGADRPLAQLDQLGKLVLAAGLRATPEDRDGQQMAHPTDRAVAEGARTAGVGADFGAQDWRLLGELPFEPSRGYHAVVGRTSAGHRIAVKGAPETILPLCDRQMRDGGAARLGNRARQAIIRRADQLAAHGYRVLAVAERQATGHVDLGEDRVERLSFLGFLALTDPARETAAASIRGLRAAHVEVKMLTGDHPGTAEAVGAKLGLLNGHRVVTGQELDAAGEAEFRQLVAEAAVFARVSPDHKVRIVDALRQGGQVVAVTGDGANDAPAIRLADVGVALGKRGTNAAKEAADIVVTDDRIETIIDAIAEGRAMWSSVRAAIGILLGGNVGEIIFTVGTSLLPGGSPLNARQILLVNLFTDMVPSLALAVQAPGSETPEALLREGPEASLGNSLTRDIMIRGGLTAGAGLTAWLGGRLTGISAQRASTVALVGIVGAQLGQTLAAGWRSPLVAAASLGSAAVLAAVIQTPGLSQFFGCTPLGPVGWAIGLSAAAGASVGAPLATRLAASAVPTGETPDRNGTAEGVRGSAAVKRNSQLVIGWLREL